MSFHNSRPRPPRQPETLYHKDLGFPADVNVPKSGKVALQYGDHARIEALLDRFGKIDLPSTIDLDKCEVVEIGVTDRRTVKKMVVRTKHDHTHDIVIVLQPNDGFVRTVWWNHKHDKHRTLDTSKYQLP
jgi:hypothetical protein